MQEPINPDHDHPALTQALAELAELKEQVSVMTAEQTSARSSWQGWFAAAGTASVTLLAFLIPSVQEQWDRVRQRAAIEDCREIARELMKEAKFHEAELMFARALELAVEPRLDIERERLVAKTDQVNADTEWSGSIDEAVEESDFVVLETMQARAHDLPGRAWTLNNHAVFLAHAGKTEGARARAEQAVALQPSDARLRVTLGNVLWDMGRLDDAKSAYRAAVEHNPNDIAAHYNLGLLYETLGNATAAVAELKRVLAIRPEDTARHELERIAASSG